MWSHSPPCRPTGRAAAGACTPHIPHISLKFVTCCRSTRQSLTRGAQTGSTSSSGESVSRVCFLCPLLPPSGGLVHTRCLLTVFLPLLNLERSGGCLQVMCTTNCLYSITTDVLVGSVIPKPSSLKYSPKCLLNTHSRAPPQISRGDFTKAFHVILLLPQRNSTASE